MQQTFPCSSCGSPNFVGEQFCVACGQKFQYNCPYCGSIVFPTMVNCPNCRGPLNWPTPGKKAQPPALVEDRMMQQQQQQQQQRTHRGEREEKPKGERKSPWPLLFAIIFVLGVAIIFIYVLLKMA